MSDKVLCDADMEPCQEYERPPEPLGDWPLGPDGEPACDECGWSKASHEGV